MGNNGVGGGGRSYWNSCFSRHFSDSYLVIINIYIFFILKNAR